MASGTTYGPLAHRAARLQRHGEASRGGGGGGTGIDWGRGSRSGRPQEEKPTMKILVWSVIAGTGALGIWMWLTGGC